MQLNILMEVVHNGDNMVKFKVEDANFNKIYPVGSIYMSVNSTNPSTLFGGTWEQIEDRFLLACGTTYANGTMDGSADAVVVEHTHTPNNASSEYFVTNTNSGATNTRVTVPTTGSNYADVKTDASFHHRTLSTTGESATGKNMPPYLAVYVWVRTE